MKKYKIIKGLVLFIALFAVACFFTPFAYGAFNSGISLGFDFIIGTSEDDTVLLGIWITRLSAVLAVVAVVFAVLPLVIKDTNGFNKQGKIHKSLFISIALSLSSAILNFISMLIGVCSVVYEAGPWGERSYSVYDEFYTFIGLICVVVLLIPVIVLCVKLKSDNAKIKATPQVENAVDNKVTNPVVTQPKSATAKSVASTATVTTQPKPATEQAVVSSATTTTQSKPATEQAVAGSATITTQPEHTVAKPSEKTNVSKTEKKTTVASESKQPKAKNQLLEKFVNSIKRILKVIKQFFIGMSRANKTIYGDLEGSMTKLKSGRRPISIEDGKCIAWIVGLDDIVLSKENVKGLELTCEHQQVSITNCGGALCDAAIYTITMRNGEVGTLRLKSTLSNYVLQAINTEPHSITTSDDVVQTPQQTTTADGPIGKPLEWFSSKEGLEAYKTYITPQNYMLEEFCKQEHKQKCADADFDKVYLPVYHEDAKLPRIFFRALTESLDVQPLRYVGPSEALIMFLEDIAKPYALDDDGEPVLRNPILTPEQIVSVEKNPLLNFVKNFDVFELKDDVVGTMVDKYNLYKAILVFLSVFAGKIIMEENQWLFDKSVYLNDFGTVRKEKGFLKKCKEMTNDSDFIAIFDEYLSKLN